MSKSRAAAARIFALLDRVPAIDNCPDAPDAVRTPSGNPPVVLNPSSVRGVVEFRNVTFAYPSRPDEPVLRNFSLTIQPGAWLGGLGSRGSDPVAG